MTVSIGMFDSGVGGLTVLHEAKKLLTNDRFIYFGDTARCPYGNKSPATITRYSLENGSFLQAHNIDILVVACNTASAVALDALKEQFCIPILDVISPTIQRACTATKNGHIGVIGTKATIQSGIHQRKLQELRPDIRVYTQACPLFVPLIEEQCANHTIIDLVIEEYLSLLLKQKIDTIILGCTHYPLIQQEIQKALGDTVTIINPAIACAEALLVLRNSLQIRTLAKQDIQFFVSDDPDRFRQIGEKFFGHQLPKINIPELVVYQD